MSGNGRRTSGTFSDEEYRWRFERTRAWLDEQQLDVLVAYSYKSALTAYWTGYSPRASVTNAAILAVDRMGRALHVTRLPLHLATATTGPRQLEQACPAASSLAVASLEDMVDVLQRWLPGGVQVGVAAYPPEAGLLSHLDRVGDWRDCTRELSRLISTRSPEQVTVLREAAEVAQAAFDAGLDAARIGGTAREAAAAAEAVMRERGGVVHCFAGVSDQQGRSLLHARDEQLASGMMLTLETIPEAGLFCPEVISTVYLGAVPSPVNGIDTDVRECLSETIAMLDAATSPADVVRSVSSMLVQAGLPPDAAIRLGHGTGLDNIEPPETFLGTDHEPFGADTVISIHPNAVVPSSATVIRGGTVVVRERGCEPLFRLPQGPIVVE